MHACMLHELIYIYIYQLLPRGYLAGQPYTAYRSLLMGYHWKCQVYIYIFRDVSRSYSLPPEVESPSRMSSSQRLRPSWVAWSSSGPDGVVAPSGCKLRPAPHPWMRWTKPWKSCRGASWRFGSALEAIKTTHFLGGVEVNKSQNHMQDKCLCCRGQLFLVRGGCQLW